MRNFTIVTSSICVFCVGSLQAHELNIYALGHMSVDGVDDGISSSVYIASNSSRLGVNGKYNVSDDFSVLFQYETGVDLTAQGGNDGNGGAQSSGQLFTKGRPSYLGLQGGFGQVLVGHLPFLDQWANDYNLFADQVGDLGNLWEASGIPGRADNVIYYKTPDFSGFNIAASVVPEEGYDDSTVYAVKGSYTSDALKLGLVYSSIGKGWGVNTEHTGYALTVGYYFDGISVGGGYQQENDISGVYDNDRTSYSAGASMDIGQSGKIKIQFATTSTDATADEADATQVAIGYDHKLANDAILYIAYARMDNDPNVNFSVNGKGHGDKIVPLIGNDPSALSIGIIYKFNHKLY